MPCSLVVISRTRQRVRSSTPARIAAGQYVMSVLALAPCAQPEVQWPRLMHGARPSHSTVAIALSEGHQCQPSLLSPRANVAPDLPSGSGGIIGSCGGYAGSPAKPDPPIISALSAYNGPSVA